MIIYRLKVQASIQTTKAISAFRFFFFCFVSSQQKGKNGDLLHLLRIIMGDGLLISYNNSAG